MESVGHSRLLKFILPSSSIKTPKMSEPYKIKFDYKHPENIDAEVPNEQKLRENDERVSNEEDSTFVPIMSITKEEAVFSKGDLKLQKISVTENISENKDGGMYIVINPLFSTITGEVINGPQPLRQMNDEKQQDSTKEDRNQVEEKRTRTRIPMLKFKQTVEKVKNQKKNSEEMENEEPPTRISQKRRSSIPRRRRLTSAIKDSANQSDENNVGKDMNDNNNNNQNNENNEKIVNKNVEDFMYKEENNVNKDSTVNNGQDKRANNEAINDTKPEDEFDKIYEQIIDSEENEVVIGENMLTDNTEDPEKLETSFEEIIHAYEEKPIVKSKIPLLKQKSLHDIKFPAKTERRLSLKNGDSEGNITVDNKLKIKGDLRPNENKFELPRYNLTQTKDTIKNTHIYVEEKPTLPKEFIKETVKVATPVFTTDNKSNNVEKYHDKSEIVPNIDYNSEIPDSSKMVRNIQAGTQAKNVTKDSRINERKTDISKESDDNELITKENTILSGKVTKIINKLDEKVPVNDRKNYTSHMPMISVSEIDVVGSKKEIVVVNPNKYKPEINTKYDQKVEPFKEEENRIEKMPVIEKNKQEKQINEIKYLAEKPDKLVTIQKVTRIYSENSEKTTEKEIIIETENIPCVKGKVNKIINRLVSHDGIETTNKKEYIEPVPIYLPEKSDKLVTIEKLTKIDPENSEKTTVKDIIIEDENMPCVKRKVSKIINRLVSHDSIETTIKKEYSEPVPTLSKKSVSSKIAMFERQVSDTTPPPKPLGTKIPKPQHKGSVHKPKIIHEVLKPHTNENSVANVANVETPATTEAMLFEESLKVMNDRGNELHNLNDNIEQMAHEKNLKIGNQINNKMNNLNENPEIIEQMAREENIKIINDKDEVKNNLNKNPEIMKQMAYEENLKVINDIENELNNIKEDVFESKSKIEANEINEIGISEHNSKNASIHVNLKPCQEITEPKKEEIKIDEKVKVKRINETKIINCEFKPHCNKFLKTMKSHEDRRALWTVDDKEQKNESNESTDSSIEKKYGKFTKTATTSSIEDRLKRMISQTEDTMRRSKSIAELDLGDAVKGKVHKMIVRINSAEKIEVERKEINLKERPRKRSVSEKIALFEKKLIPVQMEETSEKAAKIETKPKLKATEQNNISDETYEEKIAELANAKLKYGRMNDMIYVKLRNGTDMPVLAIGTALLDPRLLSHVIGAAIDLGYRAIDTAFIYGNEKEVGEAIKAKIDDGTVKREDLFIINKLWSTFHRKDLVETACQSSLDAMSLEYFDLYLIHNPMSFLEGADPIPKIANVILFSTSDYLDAWYGMEELINKSLVKSIGVSNFNSEQIARVTERARVKPVVNQVECHPYLTQQRLERFCAERDVKLSCFGVLGSKGTPDAYKSNLAPVIDDPLVKCMAAGLQITPAQMLIRYQIESGHSAVVKCSSAAHLWDNLQSLSITLSQTQVDALHALNSNKRTHAFKGLGDTHKNYPFKIPF